jgi:hypothetical protein
MVGRSTCNPLEASFIPSYRPAMQPSPGLLGMCLCALTAMLANGASSFPSPKHLGNIRDYGRAIERTMTLRTTSTPEHRNTVKILSCGRHALEITGDVRADMASLRVFRSPLP